MKFFFFFFVFFEDAFKCHKAKSFINLSDILNATDLPCLSNVQREFCEIELGETELPNTLKPLSNNKLQGMMD